jgi:hypothetical protein
MATTKVLVFIPIGDQSEALSWLRNFPERIDLQISILLIHYGSESNFGEKFNDSRIKIVNDSSPSKFEKFVKYVDNGLIKIDDYDLFWIADDDIKIGKEDILNFIDIFLEFKLYIAQPGCLGFAMGKQIVRRNSRFKLRYSNYVDGIAPMFNRSALKKCIETFRDCESGRGIDHVWAAILENTKKGIAIIDAALMIHMKPSGIDYARFDNSIQNQYEKIKKRYLKQVEQYYDWENLVIHDSIPKSSIMNRSKLINNTYDKLLEVRQIGIGTLFRYFVHKPKKKKLIWRT